MWASVTDLGKRRGTPLQGSAAEWWTSGEALQRFLAAHSVEWWVAEGSDEGTLVGFGRSLERGGLFELIELFVLPTHQSSGVGRELIKRAFPLGRGEIRSIIATLDVRAVSRYYRAGTTARFPILTLMGSPPKTQVATDLVADPIDLGATGVYNAVSDLDRSVLEYPRSGEEIRWLVEKREGFLYRRDGEAVGFAFLGKDGVGPIAVRDADDLPSILLHVEDRAFGAGMKTIEFQVPAPNEVATRHLLSRGFLLDPWVNLLMSNRPFGHFDRLVSFGPPVFL
jgi:GNAT superfamily N-acetyltransferase